jgi:tetratricopeptide (TPR) repeat protein
LHDWEISAGGNIMAWMDERHQKADSVLCVVSSRYLDAPCSALERHGAQWAAVSKRPNFLLPVFVESCEAPTLLAPLKRCDLHGLNEDEARARLETFMTPASKPNGPVHFPGLPKPSAVVPTAPVAFPGGPRAASNIPINVPLHFLGRDDDLAAIDAVLKTENGNGRAVVTALHGLRGVGKTTLAAAYAERHRSDYRATWWIRAETESTMRADLVGLGVRLGWVAVDAPEEPAVAAILERLREDGDGILLVYDNAINADEIRKYLPRGETARIIVTSNAPNWGGVAAPVEIEIWPKEVGADYLMARTGRKSEREAALALSEALGGLPLAHEQAAAYCERLGTTLSDYRKRFEAAPSKLLDAEKDAPAEYHDRLTVAKTFALAIDEAAKLHPAAEPLIVYAALLAPEPIPLFLFSEAREKFGKPIAANLAGDGLDEAVAAPRAFALLDRETIPDEREPAITTDCIRLHRLVRQVAAVRREEDIGGNAKWALIAALADVYPGGVLKNPDAWPRARRLDALAMALVAGDVPLPEGAELAAAYLLNQLAGFRQGPLAAYALVRPLLERALALYENAMGSDDPIVASILNNLGYLLQEQGDLEGARTIHERALAISESALGVDHPDVAACLNNLGTLLRDCGDRAQALPYFERALTINEKALGPLHPDTALCLNNLGLVLREQGEFSRALPFYERALEIRERVLGPYHPDTAASLNNLGGLLRAQGNLPGALPYLERALAINERTLGPDHPDTALGLNNLGYLLGALGRQVEARYYYERALAVLEKAFGHSHASTQRVAGNTAKVLDALGHRNEAEALRENYGITDSDSS